MSNYSCLFFLLFIVSNFTTIAQEGKDTSINVYFDTDSYKLEPLQSENLKHFFSSFPEIKQIIGYTDSTGNPGYNLSLSRKRALSISVFLQTHLDSLKKDQLIFRGESSSLPELWMNRRVQVIAIQKQKRLITQKTDNSRIDISEDSSQKTGTYNNKDTVGSHLLPAPPKLNAQVAGDTISNFFLENVFFVPDQPIVTAESLPYIKELANVLTNHVEENIEIIGHINYQSRFDSTHLRDLFKLSQLRAKTIYDYLTEFGISRSRMTFKGVGNSQPTYPRPVNDDQRRKNMRVQIIIKE